MNKMYMSIGIALSMLLVVSVGSVIGTNHEHGSTQVGVTSPLYQVQTSRFTQKTSEPVSAAFIGNHVLPSQYGFTSHAVEKGFEKAFHFLQNHPDVLAKIVPLLCAHESIQPILKEHNIPKSSIYQQFTLLQQNPELFSELLNTQIDVSQLQSPSTVGLNSSNPLAILIVLIALLPVLVTLVLVIATATIITCFNIGGCFEAVFNAIVYGFINGLEPA